MEYEYTASINLKLDSTAQKFLSAHELGPDVLDIEPDQADVWLALHNEIHSWLNDLGIEVELDLKDVVAQWLGY